MDNTYIPSTGQWLIMAENAINCHAVEFLIVTHSHSPRACLVTSHRSVRTISIRVSEQLYSSMVPTYMSTQVKARPARQSAREFGHYSTVVIRWYW